MKTAVPFLGVQGFMVTKFATTHGVESQARDLVGAYMMTPDAQVALAAANGRFPANTVAGKRVNDPVLASSARPASAACRCRTSPRCPRCGRSSAAPG